MNADHKIDDARKDLIKASAALAKAQNEMSIALDEIHQAATVTDQLLPGAARDSQTLARRSMDAAAIIRKIEFGDIVVRAERLAEKANEHLCRAF